MKWFFLTLSINLSFCLISLPIDCTFEHGWCNFFHDDTANFQWERTNIATESSNTGPGFGMFQKKRILN